MVWGDVLVTVETDHFDDICFLLFLSIFVWFTVISVDVDKDPPGFVLILPRFITSVEIDSSVSNSCNNFISPFIICLTKDTCNLVIIVISRG